MGKNYLKYFLKQIEVRKEIIKAGYNVGRGSKKISYFFSFQSKFFPLILLKNFLLF